MYGNLGMVMLVQGIELPWLGAWDVAKPSRERDLRDFERSMTPVRVLSVVVVRRVNNLV